MTGLTGKRILITRAEKQAADLANALTAEGAQAIPFATIQITPLEDFQQLDTALQKLAAGHYHWVIFTSVNGVEACQERLAPNNLDSRIFANVKIAAIGPATASAIQELGAQVDLVPQEYVAESILQSMGNVMGQNILLPRAELARKALKDALIQAGANVDEVAVYHTIQPKPDVAGLTALRKGVDLITFTSSSTVRNFVNIAGTETGHAVIACIGPITAQTAQELGLRVDIVAKTYTIPGLVQAIKEHYHAQP